MAITSIARLKEWFSAGKRPTGEQFASLIDSFFHKNESIDISSIEGLATALNNRLTAEDGATQPYVVRNLGDTAAGQLNAFLDGLSAGNPGAGVYSFKIAGRYDAYLFCGQNASLWQVLIAPVFITVGGKIEENSFPMTGSENVQIHFRYRTSSGWEAWNSVASRANAIGLQFTNSQRVNEVVKELYADKGGLGYLYISRINKNYLYNGEYVTQVAVSNSSNELVAQYYLKSATKMAESSIPYFLKLQSDDVSIYAVMQWNKIPDGNYWTSQDYNVGTIQPICTADRNALSLFPIIHAYIMSTGGGGSPAVINSDDLTL